MSTGGAGDNGTGFTKEELDNGLRNLPILFASRFRTFLAYSPILCNQISGYEIKERNEKHFDLDVAVPTARIYSHGQKSAPIIDGPCYISARQEVLSRKGGRK